MATVVPVADELAAVADQEMLLAAELPLDAVAEQEVAVHQEIQSVAVVAYLVEVKHMHSATVEESSVAIQETRFAAVVETFAGHKVRDSDLPPVAVAVDAAGNSKSSEDAAASLPPQASRPVSSSVSCRAC